MIRLVRGRLQGLVDDPRLAAAAVPVGAIALFVVKGGGFESTTFYPVALLLLGLVAVVAISQLRAGYAPSRAALAAIVCFAAYTVWCYASIAWSADQGTAWVGREPHAALPQRSSPLRAAAVAPPDARRAARFALAVDRRQRPLGAGAGRQGSQPGSLLPARTLCRPYGYQNAACAWYLIAVWPMLLVASRREAADRRRGPCRAPRSACCRRSRCSARVAARWLRPRSRPSRISCSSRAGLGRSSSAPPPCSRRSSSTVGSSTSTRRSGAGTASFTRSPRVRNAVVLDRGRPASSSVPPSPWSIAHGRSPGCAAPPRQGVFASRRARGPRRRRPAGPHVPPPGARFTRRGRLQGHVESPRPRFSYFANGLGGNRYDVWRVAWTEFKAKPILGIGVDNFEADYLKERRSQEEPLYPHSVELRLLSQTGARRRLLFLGFLGRARRDDSAALPAARLQDRRARRRSHRCRASTGVHGSIDWFWEIPAPAGSPPRALGRRCPSLNPPRELHARPRGWCARRRCPLVAVARRRGCCCGRPGRGSPPRTSRARRAGGAGPGARLLTARLGARLNPLSSEPELVEGAIARRLGEDPPGEGAVPAGVDAAAARLVRASRAGDRASRDRPPRVGRAERELDAARRLDPLEHTLRIVGDHIEARDPLKPSELDEIFSTGSSA